MGLRKVGTSIATVALMVAVPVSGAAVVQAAGIGSHAKAVVADGNNGNGNHGSNGNGNNGNNGNGNNGNGNNGDGHNNNTGGGSNSVPESPFAIVFPLAIAGAAWLTYRKKSGQRSVFQQ